MNLVLRGLISVRSATRIDRNAIYLGVVVKKIITILTLGSMLILSACFEPKEYKVKTEIVGEGFIEPEVETVKEGEEATFTVVSNYNSTFVGIEGCPFEKNGVRVHVKNLTSDCTLLVQFEPSSGFEAIVLGTYTNSPKLNVYNAWKSIDIDKVTIQGVVYESENHERGRRLNTFTETIRFLGSEESVDLEIYIKGYDLWTSTGYIIEVVKATNCSFGIWSTSDCTDALWVRPTNEDGNNVVQLRENEGI